MEKFLVSIGLILFGLTVGQLIKLLVDRNIIKESVPVDEYVNFFQKVVILGLNPAVVVSSVWAVRMDNLKYAALPFLGLAIIILGGLLGMIFSKMMGFDRRQTGSMIISSGFTNMGSFGGLVCFVFWGEASYAFVSMVRLFEELFYYSVGYPVAKLFGNDSQDENKNNLIKLFKDPFIIVYFLSIIAGFGLNLSGIPRPEIFKSINEMLIPFSSLILVISVGFFMKMGAVMGFLRVGFIITLIKMLLVPAIITSIAFMLGLGETYDGLILKVIMVLSAMPPAFTSLIPPQIYGLDIDQSNSCWLLGTAALVVELPLLYMIQRAL